MWFDSFILFSKNLYYYGYHLHYCLRMLAKEFRSFEIRIIGISSLNCVQVPGQVTDRNAVKKMGQLQHDKKWENSLRRLERRSK